MAAAQSSMNPCSVVVLLKDRIVSNGGAYGNWRTVSQNESITALQVYRLSVPVKRGHYDDGISVKWKAILMIDGEI